MRHLLFLAKYLSHPKTQNTNRFSISKKLKIIAKILGKDTILAVLF